MGGLVYVLFHRYMVRVRRGRPRDTLGSALKKLEERISTDGTVLPGDILKVGSFLNQNIDVALLGEMADEVARLYADADVTKVLTIEASGIPVAVATGMAMGVPVLFAKKHHTSNVDGSVWSAVVHSFTQDIDYRIVVSRDYLRPDDRVLLVDDFLAKGGAMRGLLALCEQAGATAVGAAVQIEKCFSGAGDELRAAGFRVESLAMIESMGPDGIVFRS